MFTQLVMISTTILLVWLGVSFLHRSREINYISGKTLALGLAFVATGILFYSIRDIFVQFKIYSIQETILKIGGIFHLLGVIITFWFVCKQFTSARLSNVFLAIGFLLIIGSVIAIGNIPLTEEVIDAPFEPISYQVVRNYIDSKNMTAAFPIILWMMVISPILLTTIILFNTLKLKDKEERTKGLLYGFGFLFLFVPMIVCLFISPIYARWGYLIGAILLYKAFNMRI